MEIRNIRKRGRRSRPFLFGLPNVYYEAIYYQIPADTAALRIGIWASVVKDYTEEQISELTDEQKNKLQEEAFELLAEVLSKRPVWFMIDESYGEYKILMYYDNEYNRANGEDL